MCNVPIDAQVHAIRMTESNFNWSVKSNTRLFWFHLTLHCDWSYQLAPISPPIRSKTKKQSCFPTPQAVCLVFKLSSRWVMIVQTLILTAHGDYFSNWFFYCSE